jgi:hypothetical protein
MIYCVKCRRKVAGKDVKEAPITWTGKDGSSKSRSGIHATCPTCNNRIKQFKKGGSVKAGATAAP